MASSTLIAALVALTSLLTGLVILAPDARISRIATPMVPMDKVVGTVSANVKLHCTIEETWDLLTDFKNYGTWSEVQKGLVWERVDVSGRPEVGTTGVLEFTLPSSRHTSSFAKLRLNAFDPVKRRIEWGGIGAPFWVWVAERVEEVHELPGGDGLWSEYRTWDSWSGPMAYIVQWGPRKWIEKNYEVFKDEMERVCERKRAARD